MRKFLSLFTTAALAAQLFVAMGAVLPAQAAIPECSASMTAQNGYKVAPGHGKVFYVDTGLNPKVDAAYVAYKVTNSTGSLKSPYVVLDSFTGGNVSLANPLDSSLQIREIADTQAKTAFFLLRSNGGTTTRQSHLVKVYANNPAVDSTPLLTCSFTFVKVTETIKANANKINDISHAYSGGTARIGGTLTTTVTGKTGIIGDGSSPDFSLFWASPAAYSSWPTRSLRLEQTTITLDCTYEPTRNNPVPDITLDNVLFLQEANKCIDSSQAGWSGTYVFRIIGGAASAPKPSPVANIASGTKYKHSDTEAIGTGANANPALTAIQGITPTGVTVRHSGAVASSTPQTINIRYTTTISSTVDVVVDELFDKQFSWSGTVTYVGGSLTRNGVQISVGDEASLLSPEKSLNPPLIRLFGPISVSSGNPVTYTYEKQYQCGSSARTAAFAKIGDTTFGSEDYRLASASLVSSAIGGGNCTAEISSVTETLDPLVRTDAPTSVTTNAATLQGYVDPYGQSGTFYRFSYSTDPRLVSSVTTSGWVLTGSTNPKAVSTEISGLTAGATYYFRAELKNSAGSVFLGNVLAFNAQTVQTAPVATTLPAAPISSTAVTLSGEIDPNLTTVTGVRFRWSSSQTMTNATNTPLLQDLDESGNLVTLQLPGDGLNEVSQKLDGLTSGTTYFYQVEAQCTVNATYCPNGFVRGEVLSFTAGAPAVSTEPASNIGASSASISSLVTYGSPVNHKFVYCEEGVNGCSADTVINSDLSTSQVVVSGTPSAPLVSASLTGLTPGAKYFYFARGESSTDPALVSVGRVLSFQTLLITTGSPLSGGTVGAPYLAAISGIGGSGGYVWSITSGTLPSGLTLSSGGVLSGTPTSSGSATVTVQMYDPTNGTTTTKQFTIEIAAAVSHTVTFKPNFNGATASDVVQSSTGPANLAANGFTRLGYSFAGWALSGTGAVAYTDQENFSFVSDITLFARWNSLVEYDYSGSSNNSTLNNLVLDGQSVTLPTPNSRTGFDFSGWVVSGSPSVLVSSQYTPNGNVTLVASWSSNVVNNNNSSFTITFDGNYPSSGQQTQTANTGSVTLDNNGFTRSGWTFEGWATTPTGAVVHLNGAQIQLSGNLTLYAVWTEIPVPGFIATFHPGFTGVDNVTQSIPVSGNLRANPFTLDGFLFSGWATSPGGRVIYSDMQAVTLTGNLDLYGIWAERAPALDPYRVTYTSIGSDGGRWPDRESSPSKFFHTVRDNISLTKKDHRFGGWYNFTNPSVTYKVGERIYVETNLRLAPIWLEVSRAQFTNQLSSHGTGPAPIEGFVGQAVILPTELDLKRKGHDFVGWRNNSSQPPIDYRPGTQLVLPSGGVVLDPIWQAVTSYELTLDPGNGDPIRIIQLDPNGPALPLTPPTRDGYKFQGWYDAVTGLIEPGPVEPNSNRKLIARWIEIFKITLDFNGVAPGIQELPFVAGDPAITPPTPVRPGYNFLGWLIGPSFEQRVAAPITPTGNVTLRASWELITFKVTLQHFSDPTKDVVLEYAPGGAALDLPRWVRQSFQLRGWTPSETGLTPFFGSFVPTGDSTLYTSWTLKRTIFFGGDSSRLTPAATRTLTQVAALLRGANQTLHVSTVGWVKETANKDIDARLSRDRAVQTNAFLRRSLQFATATAVGRGIFGIDSPISRRAELTVIVTGARKS